MWNKKVHDFGNVQANVTLSATFKFDGEINVDHVDTACGCTNARWNAETKELTVDYTPTPVGKHLKDKDSYISRKQITVYKVNDKDHPDILFIGAQVFNNLKQ